MARLTILLALLAALLFAAQASARQHQQQGSGCERELSRAPNLRTCGYYVKLKIRQQEREYEEGDEEGEGRVLRMAASHNKEITEETFKNWCCDQLRVLDPNCICEALQQVYENQKEELQGKEQILEGQVWYLPATCGVRHPYGCDISGRKY